VTGERMPRRTGRERLPDKRPAFETPALLRPVAGDPDMRRPASTVAGAVLVLLRAAAGALWVATATFGWTGWVQDVLGVITGDGSADLSGDELAAGRVVFVVGAALVLSVVAVLGVLILRGRNLPRVLVMVFSTLSISAVFVGWWENGQDIRIQTTLVTLSLDILILLALSSRSAAAYARRNQRAS
jgi:hypothetical protein